MITPSRLEELLEALGQLLEKRGLAYTLITVGGGSLLLQRLSVRPTRDLDVIAVGDGKAFRKADVLPASLLEASRDVGTAAGVGENWLNAGPTGLMDFGLPAGFDERAEVRRFGDLTLHIASRFDQICFKLYAAVDQAPASKHLDDLRLLEPTAQELVAAARWSMTQDPSEGYRGQLLALLQILGVPDADRQF
ncbi:MAG TPA: hypothetical protein VIO37_10235 [Candidatus Dormibacteraeota bacterium]|jgi:hypothetical protein